MLFMSSDNIKLKEFSTLTKTITINHSDYSLFFCVGLSLIRVFLGSKEDEKTHSTLSALIFKCLSDVEATYGTETRECVENYRTILNYLKNSDSESKIEKYTQGIASVGRYISYYLLYYNKVSPDIISSDICKVIQLTCDYFSIYIHLVEDTQDTLYESSQKTDGCLVYLYKNQHSHFYILYQADNRIFREITITNSEKYKRLAKSFGVKELPNTMRLLETMCEVIIEKNIFTDVVKKALISAVEENKNLLDSKVIRSATQIRDIFCEKHRSNTNIKITCGKEHCKECIFEIIFKKYSRENYKIHCPCEVLIAPKDADAIKISPSYKEFCIRNKGKNS